ncbi:MAG: potassium-transporting ATPase subunit KdpB [Acidobacteriaceae bacterium]|nr:potassium-transporting ATPase subunit KdpB [Acidobacteriaceae bacterium]MBV9781916.1 potassium-transporting ATPase subunit KdpB [Acidobacteriaceae bacterium]
MATIVGPPASTSPKSEDSTSLLPGKLVRARPLFDPEIVRRATRDSFTKLNPFTLVKNPVMFVVEVGALLVTVFLLRDTFAGIHGKQGFELQIALWLWFTVLFANFAEAMAEARGKAQADTLRKTKTDSIAKRLLSGKKIETVASSKLRAGDIVIAEAGDLIPGDGEVIEGIATVDESVITGESAPVIRESGGDRSAVTGGTKVLSDQIKIRITSNPGETFLDKMIALVEGAERQRTPNEIALNILIAGLTLIFLLAVATLHPFAIYAVASVHAGTAPTIAVLVSLLVCLIPTTIGGLLSAIGIAGMDRVMQHNVLAMSGKAVEASGDVNTLLLDKTGTVTLGNRQAVEFITFEGVSEEELADAAQLSSLADETPEGRSIVVLAKEKYGLRGREVSAHEAHFIPFSAYTRMSGVDIDGRMLRKGASGAIAHFIKELGGPLPSNLEEVSDRISRNGGTPLAVADSARALGIIHLKDIVKGGMKERIAQLRAMGIRSVMITGDNPLTAAAIASEAGVDDFLSQATPADKLEYIKREQREGRLVAMTGDGTNDAPALAQADVGLAMNTGTMAAKEAGNMVDLDSNPTKLIEVVAIGKQLLITRGALTTFSIANDVAKYFAIIPAMFMATYPALARFNIMGLHTPQSAVLAAVIFNALIIIALVPLALRGVKYRPVGAAALLRRNVLIYGIGGIIVPFPGIWIIDQLLAWLHLA